METDQWLAGWLEIGKYLGKSAKTAQRWAKKEGLPFYRDPGGRPIAKPSMIDEFIRNLNQSNFDDKKWRDEGIDTALGYENTKEMARKDFDERIILAQRRPRSQF